MASFFDPCVDDVIYLVQGQMSQIETKRNRVKVREKNRLYISIANSLISLFSSWEVSVNHIIFKSN